MNSDDLIEVGNLSVNSLIVGCIALVISIVVLILVIILYCVTCISVNSISTNSIKSTNYSIDYDGNFTTAGSIKATENITSINNVNSAGVNTVNAVIANELAISSTGTGILLPTPGGTPTLLNSYEEFSFASIWSDGVNSTTSLTGIIIATGASVTIKLPNITDTFVGFVTNNTAIPERFWPVLFTSFICPGVVDNAITPVMLDLNTSGVFTITQSNGSAFSSGTSGLGNSGNTSVTWLRV